MAIAFVYFRNEVPNPEKISKTILFQSETTVEEGLEAIAEAFDLRNELWRMGLISKGQFLNPSTKLSADAEIIVFLRPELKLTD
jgi:hypothetical protein